MHHFTRSLRNTGYKGTIFFGVKKHLDPATKAAFEEHCVFAVDSSVFDKKYLPNMPVASRRFPLYSSWIKLLLQMHQVEASSWILLVDVRDTLFQRSPFSFDSPLNASASASVSSSESELFFFGDSHAAMTLEGNVQGHTYLGADCFKGVGVQEQIKTRIRQNEKTNPDSALVRGLQVQ
jgi:hypothetical protein